MRECLPPSMDEALQTSKQAGRRRQPRPSPSAPPSTLPLLSLVPSADENNDSATRWLVYFFSERSGSHRGTMQNSLFSSSLQDVTTRLPSAIPEDFHITKWSHTGIWTCVSILITLALSRVLYGRVMYMFCTAGMVTIAVASGSLSEPSFWYSQHSPISVSTDAQIHAVIFHAVHGSTAHICTSCDQFMRVDAKTMGIRSPRLFFFLLGTFKLFCCLWLYEAPLFAHARLYNKIVNGCYIVLALFTIELSFWRGGAPAPVGLQRASQCLKSLSRVNEVQLTSISLSLQFPQVPMLCLSVYRFYLILKLDRAYNGRRAKPKSNPYKSKRLYFKMKRIQKRKRFGDSEG